MKLVGKRTFSQFRTDILELIQYKKYTLTNEGFEEVEYLHLPSGMKIGFIIYSSNNNVVFRRNPSIEGDSKKRVYLERHTLQELKKYVEKKKNIISLFTDYTYVVDEGQVAKKDKKIIFPFFLFFISVFLLFTILFDVITGISFIIPPIFGYVIFLYFYKKWLYKKYKLKTNDA